MKSARYFFVQVSFSGRFHLPLLWGRDYPLGANRITPAKFGKNFFGLQKGENEPCQRELKAPAQFARNAEANAKGVIV